MCVSACSSACCCSTISATPSGSIVEKRCGPILLIRAPDACPLSVLWGRPSWSSALCFILSSSFQSRAVFLLVHYQRIDRSTTLWTFVPHSYVRYDSPQFQALFGPRSTKSVDFRQLPGLAETQLEYGNDLLPNTKSIFLY